MITTPQTRWSCGNTVERVRYLCGDLRKRIFTKSESSSMAVEKLGFCITVGGRTTKGIQVLDH